jgi:hypothetical protein
MEPIQRRRHHQVIRVLGKGTQSLSGQVAHGGSARRNWRWPQQPAQQLGTSDPHRAIGVTKG